MSSTGPFAARTAHCRPSRFLCRPMMRTRKAIIHSAGDLHPALASVTRWIVGGHSMGARAAADAAAQAEQSDHQGPVIVGAVFSSYPLHPPGKPVCSSCAIQCSGPVHCIALGCGPLSSGRRG
jgi:predicted alpha/beta-hydrolase family hydrolase